MLRRKSVVVCGLFGIGLGGALALGACNDSFVYPTSSSLGGAAGTGSTAEAGSAGASAAGHTGAAGNAVTLVPGTWGACSKGQFRCLRSAPLSPAVSCAAGGTGGSGDGSNAGGYAGAGGTAADQGGGSGGTGASAGQAARESDVLLVCNEVELQFEAISCPDEKPCNQIDGVCGCVAGSIVGCLASTVPSCGGAVALCGSDEQSVMAGAICAGDRSCQLGACITR